MKEKKREKKNQSLKYVLGCIYARMISETKTYSLKD